MNIKFLHSRPMAAAVIYSPLTDDDEDADCRIEKRGEEQESLVDEEQVWDLFVEARDGLAPLGEQQDLVGQRGG